ncbi:energy transducer TonB [Aliidiomarina indica]|uniref:energy transducer TonB n=1 Tax=Aliidiomarina indica TaxID=2749147 RepID=UPI00188ED971|nr:energy transducer TonB [Aliidiomarina indica]
MKMYLSVAALAALVIAGCTSTEPTDSSYADVPLSQGELQKDKWSDLIRFSPRYPEQAVMQSSEGCATIEYVITPDNTIHDLHVVTATNRLFGVSASNVVHNWNWSDLPQGIISEPVKTQTRFEFCFDRADQPCTEIQPVHACPGDDVIYSRGMRM